MSRPSTTVPPVPAILAHRPTAGGLVVPWVNVSLGDGGTDFRRQHRARAEACWTGRLCQICGNPISGVLVLFGGPDDLADMTFHEPPMHSPCAAYTAKACPMVAGRAARFASGPSASEGRRGKKCFQPGCDCDGWVPSQPGGHGGSGGAPSHPWYSVWADGYALAVRPDGTLYGGHVANPRKIRHISGASAEPATTGAGGER